MLGGGDVKMGSALMLLVPTGTYTLFAFLFSAAMLLGIALMLSLRALPALRRAGPVSLRAQGTFPMGIALGLSGVLHLGVLVSLT
jgi:prepilin peptidase CpaA